MSLKALTIISDGVEEIEAIAPVDILTRAGVEVVVAGLTPGLIKAAYGNRLVAQVSVDDADGLYDAIILPGGTINAENLASSAKVVELVRRHYEAGRIVAAICASPSHALAKAGILKGKRATGAPVFAEKLAASGAILTDERVTVDGNIVTAMGPGAALQFGLMLVEMLVDKATADKMANHWRLDR